MLSQQQRWVLLGVASALTLALAIWPNSDDKSPPAVVDVVPRTRTHVKRVPVSVLQARSIDTLRRSPAGEGRDNDMKDIFAHQSWYVPPPPPPTSQQPPAPPPLPFIYLGKVIDGSQVTVFVAQGDRNLVVKTGDVIDGLYRVENIAPPMMTFTFLPLRMQQSLEIGGAN